MGESVFVLREFPIFRGSRPFFAENEHTGLLSGCFGPLKPLRAKWFRIKIFKERYRVCGRDQGFPIALDLRLWQI